MESEKYNINIKFGWLWLLVGIIEAAWLGMNAFKPEWLGGYSSLPRRFLRLSHIAFMALAIVNIVYGLCLPFTQLSEKVKRFGSYSIILAAIFMPVVCLFCVFKSAFQVLFFLPVLLFTFAVIIMVYGLFKEETKT